MSGKIIWGPVRCSRAARAALLAVGLLVLVAARVRLTAPAPTLLLRDAHGRFLAEVPDPRDPEVGYWPLARLAPRVVAATLAVEDRRFRRHPGVDPLAVVRGVAQNLRAGRRASGASTIAMQVARLERPGPRTYPRKLVEALAALVLTARYGHSAVLAHYLRIAPYGNRVRGIAYAARRYLGKPVEDLSWAETAFLVAIPQAPARMNPYREAGRGRAAERGRRVLDTLRAAHVLGRDDYDLAVRQIAALRIPPLGRRPPEALHAVLHLERLFRHGAPPPAPLVNTTLDLDVQQAVAAMVADALGELEERGAGNAAVIVVERGTNRVVAWVGSAGYFDARHAGAYDYARVPRSPGSTLKPFLYALALERGAITPATILDDILRTPGDITNADEAFLGPLLPRVALANSRNVPAANLLDRLGLDDGYAFLRDLGLHDGDQPGRHWGLGLAIGAMPTTLERLVRAYAVLAGDGRAGELVWYRGQSLAPPRRLLSEDTARLVTLFLADPMARLPTFPRMGPSEYPFPVAVKTGTSSKYRDALTVAYSTRYVVGVWLGRPDYRPMSRLTAFSSAAGLAQRILGHLHQGQQDGLEDLQFPPPRGYRAVRICALTGKRATHACGQVLLEWFRPGQEPLEDCDAHVLEPVDARDGLLASAATPRRFVEVRRFTVLPARYAAWAAANGLPRPPVGVSPLDAPPAPLAREAPPSRLRILAPRSGLMLVRDPESPAIMTTLALRVIVEPPAEQVVWYVDGAPFRVVDYPYTTRWALAPGEHTFQARLPFARAGSEAVRVRVE